jgi:4-hydroxybutyrate CoA-transferase
VHSAFAQPGYLLERFADASADFAGATVYSLMPMSEPAYGAPAVVESLNLVTFFPGTGLRRTVNQGLATIDRQNLSDIPGLFSTGKRHADLVLLQVSAPNADGDVSLGIAVDYLPAVLAQKPFVVAQVNPRMPFTAGDTRLSLGDIDVCVDVDEPLTELPASAGDAVESAIADHVAGLVEDGDVLQAGIGSLPDLVLARLDHLKHLGGHTGIITAAWRRLIEAGVVDNSRKKRFAGTTVTTMAGGDAGFYTFLDNNPAIEFHACDQTHGREVLAAIDGLCAINSVLQMDLAGNANAETVNGRRIAAIGGLADFAGGASRAPGGKSIIALRSAFRQRDSGELVSNMIPRLDGNAPLSLASDSIDFVVTEYGVAPLRGLNADARARALIGIAHPSFRDDLSRSSGC